MPERNPTPWQAGFWLTDQEKRGILVICALLLLGVAARYFYLKHEKPMPCTPAGMENPEQKSFKQREHKHE
jgi:hypothetical protein